MSSMDTLQSAGFLPLKLVFSTVLFGDELDSHCTSTPHCLENRGIARLISVLASGLLGYCGCSQPRTCTSEALTRCQKQYDESRVTPSPDTHAKISMSDH